ncbi:MAG: hypothetical protein ACE5IR_17490 [bacterium]
MKCDRFEKYELGVLEKRAFENHLPTCRTCQSAMEKDKELLSLAGQLLQPIRAPLLWGKIEHTLRMEKQRSREKRSLFPSQLSGQFLRIAATVVLMLAVGSGAYFLFKKEGQVKSGLLEAAALDRVEKIEQQYLDAIRELEKTAGPHLADLDMELSLLYRDKLETIDAQIEQCQEALAGNPGNAHIRRYLLAALQDKKQALADIMGKDGG